MKYNNILVVNDIPGAGKVAANVNIPILTAAQLEVALLPTVLLSTQTGGFYEDIVRHEVNDDFRKMLEHWQINDIHFNTHLTGYFSNANQIIDYTNYFISEKTKNPATLLIMDPIMADNGIFYDGFDQSIAKKLAHLISQADIILPNITEACLLTGYPYKENLSIKELNELSDLLLEIGVKNSIITGVRFPKREADKIGFFIKGENIKGQWISHNYYSQFYFGTGDIAVSAIVAWFTKGYSLIEAVEKTGPIIEEVIETSNRLNRDIRRGLYFEASLHHFMNYEGD